MAKKKQRLRSAMSKKSAEFEFDGSDTRIEITYEGKKIIGTVSGDALSRASPVWKNFVTPPWHKQDNGSLEPASERPPISFLEDNAEALLLLLNVAHLQFRKIPERIGYMELYQVAVLCDQYQCVELLYPWIKHWFTDEDVESKKDGQEGWLFIAWVFGRDEVFNSLVAKLVLSAEKDERGSLSLSDSQIPEIMPLDILESITNTREKGVSLLLEVVYTTLHPYENTTTVCKQDSRYLECDALVLGSLIRGLRHQMLFPEKAAEDIKTSITGLAEGISKMQIHSLVDYYTIHYECSSLELQAKVDLALSEIPDAVLDAHRLHLAAQKESLQPLIKPQTESAESLHKEA